MLLLRTLPAVLAVLAATGCGLLLDDRSCTMMDVDAAQVLPADLVPAKDGRVEICRESVCLTTDLTEEQMRHKLNVPEAPDGVPMTVRVTSGERETFRGTARLVGEKVYPNGKGCGSKIVHHLEIVRP